MNDTQRMVLAAGVRILAEKGTSGITARKIADSLGRDHGIVAYYWPYHGALMEAVAVEAMRTDHKKAVARLIADGFPLVQNWSKAKRRAYLACLA